MKILLTGGRGKLGSAIVDKIIEAGHTISIADIKDCGAYDLTKYENAQKAVEGRDVVIHLAGIPHPSGQPFARYFETNVRLSFNVLQASLRAGVKRVIYSSSSASYGTDAAFKPLYVPIDEEHPLSVDMAANDEQAHWQYPCSKRIVDTMMLAYGKSTRLETVILRLGPLHKTEDYFGGMYKQNWARRCLFAWSDPRDMADAFIKAATMPDLKCEVFNVMGSWFPEGFKPDDKDPLSWLRDHLGEEMFSQFEATGDLASLNEDSQHRSFYSSEKAKEILGWEPEY